MQHGGDLSDAIAYYGGAFDDWLDLSTGINPEPWPVDTRLSTSALHRLPAHSEEKALIDAARHVYRAPVEAAVVAAPGTQAAIQWLPHLAREGDVAIIGPTYSEHTSSWSRAGRSVLEIEDIDAFPNGTRHAVIVNPNNPDGRIFDLKSVSALAEKIKQRDGWLVIDESFADIEPAMSSAQLCIDLPVIVLRSFGKFYGLPGLRLGFLIAAPQNAAAFRAALGPWPVSTPALIIGEAALKDHAWADATRTALAKMAQRLDEVLTSSGLKIIGGVSLFRLAYHADAKAIHEKLARKHIWCRSFDGSDTQLRFGLPRSDADLARLKDALLSP